MKFWLAIDDTDDVSKSIGTGQIAQLIYKKLEEMGCKMKFGVTRHQLLLDSAIRYTSHNSAMCMEGDSPFAQEELWNIAVTICSKHRSAVSNPGVCLFVPTDHADYMKLVEFGKNAKKVVLTIAQAYELASFVRGIRLEALSGNGDGMIGALAGVGLRLSGNDGTFQGKKKIPETGKVFLADEMIEKIGISFILDKDGKILPPDAKVRIKEHAKIIYFQFSRAAAAELQADGIYDICSLAFIYEQAFHTARKQVHCEKFEWDNDPGEQWSEQKGLCENCLYRRLVKAGYFCTCGNKVKV